MTRAPHNALACAAALVLALAGPAVASAEEAPSAPAGIVSVEHAWELDGGAPASDTDGGAPALVAQSSDVEALGASWTRLAGANRYDTMSAIVTAGFWDNSTVVIASGENFPDALSASALAGSFACPVILTANDGLSPQAVSQVVRLGVTHAYVMGGTAAVSAYAQAELETMGVTVTRVAGADRSATSVEALSAVRAAGSTSDTLIVAAGSNFPDALSVGPWAYATATPIVLCQGDGTLTADTVAAVKADKYLKSVLIVGGEASVSAAVESQLGSAYTYTRLGGANRYETSKLIAAWELQHGLTWDTPAIASGRNFPDALACAALSGVKGSILLIANTASDATAVYLSENIGKFSDGYVYGGTAATSYPSAAEGLVGISDAQKRIVAATETTPWPGPGLCAEWVADVYAAAGFPYVYGDACDLYDLYTTSSDLSDLKAGMIVAVSTHPHTVLGGIYGHVGIYVGNDRVRDSAAEGLREMDLYEWLAWYGETVPPRWGWLSTSGLA